MTLIVRKGPRTSVLDGGGALGNYASRGAFAAAIAAGARWVDGRTVFADGLQYKAQSGATSEADLPGFVRVIPDLLVTDTFLVPTDYPTVQAAIDAARNIKVAQGSEIVILIESGALWDTPLISTRAFLGHIRLTSQDAEVFADPAYPVNTNGLQFEDGVGPVLDLVLNFQGRGRNGVWAQNCNLRVRAGRGVKNVGAIGTSEPRGCGFFVWKNAVLNTVPTTSPLSGIIATGNAWRGVDVTHNSFATIVGANLSNNGTDPADNNHAALFVSRSSLVHADNSTFDGSARGIRNARSSVSARESFFRNIPGECIWQFEGGRVSASESNFEGSGAAGFDLLTLRGSSDSIPQGGGQIIAEASTFANVVSDIARVRGASGLIVLDNSTGTGIRGRVAVGTHGTISANRVNFTAHATNTRPELILASTGLTVNAFGSTVTAASGVTNVARADQDGRVNAQGATMTGSSGPALVTQDTGTIYTKGGTFDRAYPDVVGLESYVPTNFYANTGASDNTVALNNLLSSGGVIKFRRAQTFNVTSKPIFQAGTKIEGALRLAYTGANNAEILQTLGAIEFEEIQIETAATGLTTSIAAGGFKGGVFRAIHATESTPEFLRVSPVGLDVDTFDFVGFARAVKVTPASGTATGGRIGDYRVRKFIRGLGVENTNGFRLERFNIRERSAGATVGANGQNAILIETCSDGYFGSGTVADAAEHPLRTGGTGACNNIEFGTVDFSGAAGTVLKLNPNVRSSGFRMAALMGTGNFATSPGGNREFIRASHTDDIDIGVASIRLAPGAYATCNDALALNDCNRVSIGHLHADAVRGQLIHITADNDTAEGPGAGSVTEVVVGGLSGYKIEAGNAFRFNMPAPNSIGNVTVHNMAATVTDGLAGVTSGTVWSGVVRINGAVTAPAVPTLTNAPGPEVMAINLGYGADTLVNSYGRLTLVTDTVLRQGVRFGEVLPAGTTTDISVRGLNNFTAVGTATARALATTDRFTRMPRVGVVSGAGAGSQAEYYCNGRQLLVPDGTFGGFTFLCRFAITDAAPVSGARMFVGLSDATGALGNVGPTSLLNVLGVGHGNTDTNLFFYSRGSGTGSNTNLGASFPATAGIPYELWIQATTADSKIAWRVTRLDTEAFVVGARNDPSFRPASTVFLGPRLMRTNNATALAVAVDLIELSARWQV